MIYEHVFHLGHALVTGREVSRSWALQKCRIEPATLVGLPSLFLVNRQCYAEAIKPFFRATAFHFIDFVRLEHILQRAGPFNAHSMRSISLELLYATNMQEIQVGFPELRRLTIEASTLYDFNVPHIFNEMTLARHVLGDMLKPDLAEWMLKRCDGRVRWEAKMAMQQRLAPVNFDTCFHWEYYFPSRSIFDAVVSQCDELPVIC